MRVLTGLMAIATLLSFADHAAAVGGMPGGTFQFLGWGYGPGYHAPIVQAHPPVRRIVHHTPGTHWLGERVFGYSQLEPHHAGGYYSIYPAELPMYAPPYRIELLPPVDSDPVPVAPTDVPEPPVGYVLPPAPSIGDLVPRTGE